MSASISIHAPLTGSDQGGVLGAWPCGYFNPRSPYGERHFGIEDVAAALYISIHAPLTGSDSIRKQIAVLCLRFQSTLPLRGATGF